MWYRHTLWEVTRQMKFSIATEYYVHWNTRNVYKFAVCRVASCHHQVYEPFSQKAVKGLIYSLPTVSADCWDNVYCWSLVCKINYSIRIIVTRSSAGAEIVRRASRRMSLKCKTPHFLHQDQWITGYYSPCQLQHAGDQCTDLSCRANFHFFAPCDCCPPVLLTDAMLVA